MPGTGYGARRILVVEDDQDLHDLITSALRIAGYEPASATNGLDADRMLRTAEPDLVVLDLNLPQRDGLAVASAIQRSPHPVPIVVVTGETALTTRLAAFETGVDDVLVKPFALEELIARIRAVLARSHPRMPTSTRHEYADLVLDEQRHLVVRDGSPVTLTRTEFNILRYLLVNAERVVSKEQILIHAWPYQYEGDPRVVEVHLSALRRKLDRDGPPLVQTIRGVGYSLRLHA